MLPGTKWGAGRRSESEKARGGTDSNAVDGFLTPNQIGRGRIGFLRGKERATKFSTEFSREARGTRTCSLGPAQKPASFYCCSLLASPRSLGLCFCGWCCRPKSGSARSLKCASSRAHAERALCHPNKRRCRRPRAALMPFSVWFRFSGCLFAFCEFSADHIIRNPASHCTT